MAAPDIVRGETSLGWAIWFAIPIGWAGYAATLVFLGNLHRRIAR